MLNCSCMNNEHKKQQKKESKRIEKMLRKEKHRLKSEIKLLLLGTGESGKSTIIKQMKIIHGEDLSKGQPLEEVRHIIYYNIIKGIKVLIDARAKLNIPWEVDRNKNIQQAADLVFRSDLNNLITFEYFNRYTSLIETIWNDAGIQATFQKRNQYQLVY